MKTFSLNKIIAIFALLFLIGGGKILARNGQPKTLPITNYSPNGSKFYSDFTIDWTTQKLQIIVDVTNCTTDASGNNPDDIFDLCPQTSSDIGWNSPTPVVHVYCDGTQLKLHGFGCAIDDPRATVTLGSSYDKTNITIEIDNENGLTVDGNSTTFTATFLAALFNNSNLTFASQQGDGRMHGTYKSVKVVSKTVPSGIITSTNETMPEHVFTMHNANNNYVNSNLYCATGTSDYAQFAFYEVSGKTNAYYIYNYSAKKWLKYTTSTTYEAGKDFVSNGEKSERSEFYITSTAKNGVNGVQIQPYNAAGNAANNYLNFYGGGGANTDHTIGNWTDNGSSDAGSLWVFTEVEIANNNAVITNKTMSEGSVVSTLLENHTGDGTKFTRETAIDWTKQKVIAEIDISTCGTGTEDLFSIGENIQTFKANNLHVYKKASGAITAYLVGNPLGGGTTAFESSTLLDGNMLRVELSSEKGFVMNDVIVFSKEAINQYSEQYYTNQFFSLSNIQVGSGENNQNSRAKYNYISVVTNDYKATTVTSSNTLDEVTVNSFNAQNDVDVQLKRSLTPTQWNTFCVPFTISADVIAEKFGAGTLVYTFGSMNGNVMNFKASTTIEAGKPYIVKPANTVVNPTFTGVNIEASAPVKSGENGFFMQGTYGAKTDLLDDGTNLFLGEGDKFYKPAKGSTKMKGMRAFFIVPQGTNLAALRANIDGATTAIDELTTVVEQPTDNRIYNLQGQFVGTSFEGLHGVYVQNGKKVLVK